MVFIRYGMIIIIGIMLIYIMDYLMKMNGHDIWERFMIKQKLELLSDKAKKKNKRNPNK